MAKRLKRKKSATLDLPPVIGEPAKRCPHCQSKRIGPVSPCKVSCSRRYACGAEYGWGGDIIECDQSLQEWKSEEGCPTPALHAVIGKLLESYTAENIQLVLDNHTKSGS